MAGTKIWG
jgi:hypothetical protein